MTYRAQYPDLPMGRDLPRRDFQKPLGKKWSEYVFGRRLNIAHFRKYGWVRVRAYRTHAGKIFYTDPIRNPKKGGRHHPKVIGEYLIKLKQ